MLSTIEKPQRWDEPFGNEMPNELVDQLLTLAPFSNMDATAFPTNVSLRGILQNDCRVGRYEDGELVIREGDYGHSAFMILRGEVLVTLQSLPPGLLGRTTSRKKGFFESLSDGLRQSRHPETRNYDPAEKQQHGLKSAPDAERPHRVFLQDVPRMLGPDRTATMSDGDFFGELGALTRTPRSSTILSSGESFLLEIRWQGLRDLMKYDEALRQHIDGLYRSRSLKAHLRETRFLQGLDDDQISRIADATKLQTFGDFQWNRPFRSIQQLDVAQRINAEPVIAARGDYVDDLILIRNGFGRVSRPNGASEQTIAYLGKGEMFGLRELTHTWRTGEVKPWSLSLRAVGYVDILRIPSSVVQRDIFPNVSPGLLPHNFPAPGDAPHRSQKKRDETVDAGLLEFLLDHRYINGTAAMMIDLNRCTRCDDCLRACASTHDNNPRFVRVGRQHDHLMIASACMHCNDPVCMIGCPTGAIGRDPNTGSVAINDQTCVGCGTCASSCPYSNIRMVNVRDRSGNPIRDQQAGEPITKATKCDLCVSHSGGPACQNACPHDALVRINLTQPDDLTHWLTQG